jgi:hypothetical protein
MDYLRKIPQDLPIDRTMAMNMKNTEDYFSLLLDVQAENSLLGRLGHIYTTWMNLVSK